MSTHTPLAAAVVIPVAWVLGFVFPGFHTLPGLVLPPLAILLAAYSTQLSGWPRTIGLTEIAALVIAGLFLAMQPVYVVAG